MAAACTIWGLSPLFYALFPLLAPEEILGHRVLWSLVFFAGFLAVQGRMGEVRHALGSWSRFGATLLASAMITCNWYLFISSVGWGLVRESALGYYIFPLLAVLLGLLAGERLRPLQWAAVGLAAAALGVLTWDQGRVPMIALALAVTFAAYGWLKKRAPAGPVVSVTAEVVLVIPLALYWLVSYGGLWSLGTYALLALSGPLTALPLILFSTATRNIPLSAVGVLQYINPTLQFLVAVLILSEPMAGGTLAAFGLIWLAVALYSTAALSRRARAVSTDVSNQT